MKQNKKDIISLKKLTIARINLDSMLQIKGGSSLPTMPDAPTNPKICIEQ